MPDISSTKSCIKFTILILNVIVIVFGTVAVGLGLWIALDNSSFIALTHHEELSVVDQSYVRNGAYIVCTGGACAFVFGLVGMIAACTENPKILGFYVFLLAIVMTLDVAGTVVGIVFKQTWEDNLEKAISGSIYSNFDGLLDSDDFFTKHFSLFQKQKSCCGFNGSGDYSNTTKWNATTDSGAKMLIPPSCCKSWNETDIESCVTAPTESNAYLEGCEDALESLFSKYEAIIIGIAASIVFTQLLMMILALFMMCIDTENLYAFKAKES